MLRRYLILLAVTLLAACNLPQPTAEPTFDPNLVATMVEETLAGFFTPTSKVIPATATPEDSTPTAESSPTAVVSKVTGKVCYPKTGRSDLRAFFQEITKGIVFEIAISASSDDYETPLDPGNYIAYVWLPDFSFGGMYSTGTTPSPCRHPLLFSPGKPPTGLTCAIGVMVLSMCRILPDMNLNKRPAALQEVSLIPMETSRY